MANALDRIVRSLRGRFGRTDGPPGGGRGEYASDWYDRAYERVEDYHVHYTQSRYYFIWTVIADRLRRGGVRRILEVGCGPGQLAALLIDQGVEEYTGVDFSKTAIGMARSAVPRGRFEVADARSTDIYGRTEYDGIICTEVLEHIQDDLLILSMFPSGKRCVCSVPNFPYESHVRHFRDAASVRQRYGDFFEDLDVITFLSPRSADERYFLFDGVRK